MPRTSPAPSVAQAIAIAVRREVDAGHGIEIREALIAMLAICPKPPGSELAERPRIELLRHEFEALTLQLDRMVRAQSWQATVSARRQLLAIHAEIEAEGAPVGKPDTEADGTTADLLASSLLDPDKSTAVIRHSLLRDKLMLYRQAVRAESFTAAARLDAEIREMVERFRGSADAAEDLLDHDLIVSDILAAPQDALRDAVLRSPWLWQDAEVIAASKRGR